MRKSSSLVHNFLVILVTLSFMTSCGVGSQGGGSQGGGAGGGGAGGVQIHEFPWPPPKSTTTPVEMPRNLFVEPTSQTTHLFDVNRKLRLALDSQEYQRKYWSAPGGFVVVTRLEKFDPHSGQSGEGKERWGPDPDEADEVSPNFFERLLYAMYVARDGYYRVILITVTSDDVKPKGSVTNVEANRWLEGGAEELPESIANEEFTEHHKIRALVYEFKQPAHEREPFFRSESDLSAKTHLIGANIWTALKS
jgi:hypothetical protein